METRERNEGHIPPKSKAGFLAIQNLTQLIPIILFCFIAAFAIDTYDWQNSTSTNHYQSEVDSESAPLPELKKELNKELAPKINQPKPTTPPKVTPRERKNNVKPSKKVRKPNLPQLKKTHKPVPATSEEKYTSISPSQERVTTKSTEHISVTTRVLPVNPKIYPTAILSSKEIPSLEVKDLLDSENFALKENKFPTTSKKELEIIPTKTALQEVRISNPTSVAKPIKSYQSSDFAWSLNNYSQGLKKSVKFTDTPDGKAAYCKTNAGILLKINNSTDLNNDYGVFVERSEDGKEFNSIGIINVENKEALYYFDSDNSLDGQYHYRFRSTNRTGEEISFGQVSVVRPNTLNPFELRIDTKGDFSLNLSSNKTQTITYELKEAWGSLNALSGTKQIDTGENELNFQLKGEPGLYFLSLKTDQEILELLLEKPGIVSDLSFYDTQISGKQSLTKISEFADFIEDKKVLNFDFYLKNGNTLILNQGSYKSETVKIKNAKIENLPTTLRGRHSETSLWFTAASEVSYLHQKVPVLLEHNAEEIPAQINIYAAKNAVRPISHFSPDGDGIQDNWRIPGIESCPNTQLLVFNDWGNLVYKTSHVTDENIWKGQKNGKNLPAGIYYYILGNYGGWVQLER